jgi:sugar phosphate isomerase/epimerase
MRLGLLTLLLAAPVLFGADFSKKNLVAWCIVPFDARHRGPEERAAMMERLGIRKFAYDWRAQHIPEFDREIDALRKHKIELTAFWMPTGLTPEKDKNIATILEVLKRRKVKTQLWVFVSAEAALAKLPQEEKVAAAAKAVGWIADEARKTGSKVALYNHEGGSGEPENQIAIIQRLKKNNVGMVYNFNHAHKQIDRFPEFYPKMLPYLLAITLNGMKKQGPMILPIGEGDSELGMLRIIHRSRYRGPIGILGHRTEMDAEEALRLNLEGLRKLAGRLE